MPFDSLDPQAQGLATTPDNQLPQLTGLSTPSPLMTMPALSHPVPNHLSMTTQAFSPPTNPMIIPPPVSVCGCGFCRLPEVPQRPYQSTQISVESGSRIGEIVTFSKGGCGIPLRDAIENRLSGLVGGDDVMFDGFNVSAFSLRIEVGLAFRPPLSSANWFITVAGLSALDWEGAHPRCTSLGRISHPICSSVPEIGVATKGRSREHGLLSRSQSASRNPLRYNSRLPVPTRSTELIVSGNGRNALHRGGLGAGW